MQALETQPCFVCKQVFELDDLNLCIQCGQGFCDGCARHLAGCDCLVAEFIGLLENSLED